MPASSTPPICASPTPGPASRHPAITFGFEIQPGHGASSNRGEYQVKRNNIGGMLTGSVGGTGVYGAQVGGVWDALLRIASLFA